MENGSPEGLVIDNRQDGLFRVNRRAFTDPHVLELERERVFAQCWIYAGHESEIPNPGDFCARRVAGRPVILVRGTDGQVRVLLNTCTHRGAQVCRERAGNTRTFQCAYHAWTYNNQGELVGVPGEDAYSEAFDRQELGLRSAPRMESYRGFVFVSFNPAIESLVAYLAGAREYLDLVCDQSEQGMEIVSGTQLYSMRANWKLLVENSIDGYHGLPTHKRYFLEFLPDTGVDVQGMRIAGTAKSLGNGHAVIENPQVPFGRPVADWIPAWGEAKKAELEALYQKLIARFGAERAYKIAKVSRNLLIFPNLIINDIMSVTVRTFFPLAPDYMEITAWALAPKEESAEDRALRLDNFLTFLGPGGFATPDDVEMLESCQRGYANVREVQWSDISRGMKRKEPLATDELQMQVFWRRWNELVTRAQSARVKEAA
ncbi:MAG TPA: aromatic ring-hydroxylating dioxygenase subunit alpha [Candidatus Binatia bacterium]|nr:aromatic ring-hydroxylating dioxygenase subunit alpha [Candidatus Binatia bacterium]